MLSRSKALWLTFLAALAVTALAASAASANHLAFQATGEPETALEGRADAENKLTTTAGTAHCTDEAYEGVIAANTTPTTLAVTASFGGCEITPIGHGTIHMNGCTFQFHAGETDVNGKKRGQPTSSVRKDRK